MRAVGDVGRAETGFPGTAGRAAAGCAEVAGARCSGGADVGRAADFVGSLVLVVGAADRLCAALAVELLC